MKTIKIISILITIFSLNINAQKEFDYKIKPGIGISAIKIGTHIDTIIKILGKPDLSFSFNESVDTYLKLKSNPNNWIPVQIGYSKEISYSKGTESYPVFSLYFQDDSLICFSLSSFIYKKWWLEKFYISDDLKFYSKINDITDYFGDKYILLDYSQGKNKFITWAYYNKGISLLVHKNEIRMIEIFKPFDIIQKR
ncbi:MAG: hypothetical protein KAT68_00880 [Bacteroidales bacterium]|nr:hypothetical protein [Bacteroidales bacterium]